MHESHWPSNLAWLLSLCTCIPNLDEIEQFLEHGNQSTTDGQRDRQRDKPKLIFPRFLRKAGDKYNYYGLFIIIVIYIKGAVSVCRVIT